MAKNANLNKAREVKNDEFYTQLSDIEAEIKHYKEYFKDKVVFCNCDDPEWSNFWKYFSMNFKHLGLKKLIATHYKKDEKSYKLEMIDKEKDFLKIDLEGDGDFRSNECIELLKEADIVVTNPPFSLFRDFVLKLNQYNKNFLIIGSKNAITYKETFKLIMNNSIWLGITNPREFKQPNGDNKKFGNIGWFTNLEHKQRNEEIILYKNYNENDYPKYDNYEAINVDKVKDIPKDFNGAIGVPITFMDKFNPNQFEIIGMAEDNGKGFSGNIWDGKNPHCVIEGKNKFKRIFVKHKK